MTLQEMRQQLEAYDRALTFHRNQLQRRGTTAGGFYKPDFEIMFRNLLPIAEAAQAVALDKLYYDDDENIGKLFAALKALEEEKQS